MAETMSGGCHCGQVRFRVTADLSRVTDCNCSICTKKGFLHLIVPPGQFELVSGADAMTTYRFNTGIARHTFCAMPLFCTMLSRTFPGCRSKMWKPASGKG